MDEQQRRQLVERLAHAERELQRAEQELDGSPRARMRLLAAQAEAKAAEAAAQEALARAAR